MVDYRSKTDIPTPHKPKILLKKDCAINSIKEIECFLHNLDKFFRAKHLYKFLK